MSGEELYNLYVDAMAKENCAIDEWGLLDDIDRAAWSSVAKLVQYSQPVRP